MGSVGVEPAWCSCPRNCRRFWIRIFFSHVKGVNNHSDEACRGCMGLRSLQLLSLLGPRLPVGCQKCQLSQGWGRVLVTVVAYGLRMTPVFLQSVKRRPNGAPGGRHPRQLSLTYGLVTGMGRVGGAILVTVFLLDPRLPVACQPIMKFRKTWFQHPN